ncbi:hypothetical protein [Aquibium microcysteis]|uniref:hypothetical protein n=1 Tax=Aquibium microcysteis TaxID=675281 RepID=UPI00165D24DC|nr:hypothetical protein [Aquibium microcysteis]
MASYEVAPKQFQPRRTEGTSQTPMFGDIPIKQVDAEKPSSTRPFGEAARTFFKELWQDIKNLFTQSTVEQVQPMRPRASKSEIDFTRDRLSGQDLDLFIDEDGSDAGDDVPETPKRTLSTASVGTGLRIDLDDLKGETVVETEDLRSEKQKATDQRRLGEAVKTMLKPFIDSLSGPHSDFEPSAYGKEFRQGGSYLLIKDGADQLGKVGAGENALVDKQASFQRSDSHSSRLSGFAGRNLRGEAKVISDLVKDGGVAVNTGAFGKVEAGVVEEDPVKRQEEISRLAKNSVESVDRAMIRAFGEPGNPRSVETAAGRFPQELCDQLAIEFRAIDDSSAPEEKKAALKLNVARNTLFLRSLNPLIASGDTSLSPRQRQSAIQLSKGMQSLVNGVGFGGGDFHPEINTQGEGLKEKWAEGFREFAEAIVRRGDPKAVEQAVSLGGVLAFARLENERRSMVKDLFHETHVGPKVPFDVDRHDADMLAGGAYAGVKLYTEDHARKYPNENTYLRSNDTNSQLMSGISKTPEIGRIAVSLVGECNAYRSFSVTGGEIDNLAREHGVTPKEVAKGQVEFIDHLMVKVFGNPEDPASVTDAAGRYPQVLCDHLAIQFKAIDDSDAPVERKAEMKFSAATNLLVLRSLAPQLVVTKGTDRSVDTTVLQVSKAMQSLANGVGLPQGKGGAREIHPDLVNEGAYLKDRWKEGMTLFTDAILARADPVTVGEGVKTGTELLRRRETMLEDVVKLKPYEKSVIL